MKHVGLSKERIPYRHRHHHGAGGIHQKSNGRIPFIKTTIERVHIDKHFLNPCHQTLGIRKIRMFHRRNVPLSKPWMVAVVVVVVMPNHSISD